NREKHGWARPATPSLAVIPAKAANISIALCAAASLPPNTRTAKMNSLRANSRSATNVPQPKSPQSYAVADWSRCGKIGTKPFAAQKDFTDGRAREFPRAQNDCGVNRSLSIPAAINFGRAQR